MGSAYLLIVVGGLVRASGSGLGCPDWPLCHGQPLPPALPAPIIEYSHRLLATSTAALAVSVSVLILRGQTPPGLRAVAIAVPSLLALEIALGAVTVALELTANIVTVHLGLALLVLGLLVTEASLLSGATERPETIGRTSEAVSLAPLAAGLVYAQALLGGIVRGSGASLACTGFPLCNGELVPGELTSLIELHLLHRLGAVLVVGLLAFIYLRARAESSDARIVRWSGAALLLALLQGGVGAFAAASGLPPAAQVLHVAGAAALWGATVGLATSTFTQSRRRLDLIETGR